MRNAAPRELCTQAVAAVEDGATTEKDGYGECHVPPICADIAEATYKASARALPTSLLSINTVRRMCLPRLKPGTLRPTSVNVFKLRASTSSKKDNRPRGRRMLARLCQSRPGCSL